MVARAFQKIAAEDEEAALLSCGWNDDGAIFGGPDGFGAAPPDTPDADVEDEDLAQRPRALRRGARPWLPCSRHSVPHWLAPLGLALVGMLTAYHSLRGGPSQTGGGGDRHVSERGEVVGKVALVTANSTTATCHTANTTDGCFQQVIWAMREGIYSHPEWYPNLTNASDVGEFQATIHKTSPDQCPPPCLGGNPGAPPCAPPLVTDKYGACNQPKGPAHMSYYMYRAQGTQDYPVENLNLASLAGVMWYLHHEVVGSRPRKFQVTRILRYKVTMQNTQEFVSAFHKQFGPFVAFDTGATLASHNEEWDKYGFNVGCQLTSGIFAYEPFPETQPSCMPKDSPTCLSPKWYSLPGPCPEMAAGKKTADCLAKWPGGRCTSAFVKGERDCTYWTEFAGQIFLDELEGIPNYDQWWVKKDARGGTIPNGNIEYSPALDHGIGMSFWDDGRNKTRCTMRMQAVVDLFKKHFPDYPADLPEPPCT